MTFDTPPHLMSPLSPESECSETQTSTAVHSKHLYSMSTTTLQTSTTLHETPYEPLLPPITQNSRESSRRTRSSRILTLPRWPTSRAPSTLHEKNEFGIYKEPVRARSPTLSHQRARKLRWGRRLLEFLMILWSIYSTGRYLKAFTLYDGFTSQLVSLGLGTSTGLSFAFTCCSIALSLVQFRLLFHGFSVTSLLSIRSTLQYLSSTFLMGPSIANLVLLVVWRNTQDSEIGITHRCNLDVDLIWSVYSSLCNHPPHAWGTWIGLAALRIIFSALIITIFHRIASSQVIFLSDSTSFTAIPTKHSHKRLRSSAETLHSIAGPVVVPRLDRDSPGLLAIPETTSLSTKSSPRNRLRKNQSHSSGVLSGDYGRLVEKDQVPAYESGEFLPMGALSTSRSNPSLGGTFMERFRALISQITTETEQGLAFARSDSASASSLLSHDEATVSPSTSLPELVAEKYQPQYSPYPQYDPVGDEDDFYSPPHMDNGSSGYFPPMVQANAGNHSQLHHVYPEDQHIPMLNGFVRKMPTIDSMGSREKDLMSLGSGGRNSMGTSSLETPLRKNSPLSTPNSTGPRSRSPTKHSPNSRNNAADTSMDLADALGTLDFSGSERRKSLSAQAEVLAGLSGNESSVKAATEVGELPIQASGIRMIGGGIAGIEEDNYALDSLKMKLGGFSQDLDLALGFGFGSSTEYESSTSGSKESKESAGSMQTFHTAKTSGKNPDLDA